MALIDRFLNAENEFRDRDRAEPQIRFLGHVQHAVFLRDRPKSSPEQRLIRVEIPWLYLTFFKRRVGRRNVGPATHFAHKVLYEMGIRTPDGSPYTEQAISEIWRKSLFKLS